MATPELQQQITNLSNVVSLLVQRVKKNEDEIEEVKNKMKNLEKIVENTAVSSGTLSLISKEIKEQINGLKSEIAQVTSSCASASAASADLLLSKINLMFDEVFKRLPASSQSDVGDAQGHPTQSRSHHNY